MRLQFPKMPARRTNILVRYFSLPLIEIFTAAPPGPQPVQDLLLRDAVEELERGILADAVHPVRVVAAAQQRQRHYFVPAEFQGRIGLLYVVNVDGAAAGSVDALLRYREVAVHDFRAVRKAVGVLAYAAVYKLLNFV